MRVNINQILEEQGKSLLWLSNEIGMTYKGIHNLANNKTESVKFANLESICKALNCSISDILIIEEQ